MEQVVWGEVQQGNRRQLFQDSQVRNGGLVNILYPPVSFSSGSESITKSFEACLCQEDLPLAALSA